MGSIQKVQQAGGGGGGGVEDILFWKKLEFLRGCQKINFIPINSQLAARVGELIEVVVRMSMDKI